MSVILLMFPPDLVILHYTDSVQDSTVPESMVVLYCFTRYCCNYCMCLRCCVICTVKFRSSVSFGSATSYGSPSVRGVAGWLLGRFSAKWVEGGGLKAHSVQI